MNERIFELSRRLERCCSFIKDENNSIEWCKTQIEEHETKIKNITIDKEMNENTIKEIMNEIKELKDEA